jgi:hypothetical protein
MLKELKARVIHTELESLYDPGALALPTLKKSLSSRDDRSV